MLPNDYQNHKASLMLELFGCVRALWVLTLAEMLKASNLQKYNFKS